MQRWADHSPNVVLQESSSIVRFRSGLVLDLYRPTPKIPVLPGIMNATAQQGIAEKLFCWRAGEGAQLCHPPRGRLPGVLGHPGWLPAAARLWQLTVTF